MVGRKNYYGSRSKRGAEVAGLLYSLMESAKQCGLNPKEYFRQAVRAALSGERIPFLTSWPLPDGGRPLSIE